MRAFIFFREAGFVEPRYPSTWDAPGEGDSAHTRFSLWLKRTPLGYVFGD
jgi:hypothetical protein